MAVIILGMGIASPPFTRRMETSSRHVLEQMERSAKSYLARPPGVPGNAQQRRLSLAVAVEQGPAAPEKAKVRDP